MKNALSIDLEDWFCATNLGIDIKDWGTQELRIVDSTRKILRILNESNVKATFFVLGWFAEHMPEIVREIDRSGHEIATHGYSHKMLTDVSPKSFEEDLARALRVTSECIEQPIIGFRAPSFTITNKTLWVFDILVANGIKYDSSIFPVRFHPDYGIADASLEIHQRGAITEVPMSCVEVMGARIPCSGGAYFRLYPYSISRRLMRRCNAAGRPVVFYIHPWEMDPGQPRMKLPLLKAIRHYVNLDKTERRFAKLQGDFTFTSIKEILGL